MAKSQGEKLGVYHGSCPVTCTNPMIALMEFALRGVKGFKKVPLLVVLFPCKKFALWYRLAQ